MHSLSVGCLTAQKGLLISPPNGRDKGERKE